MIYGLPDKLRELREKYGLSQSEVANRLDLSASVVSGYETGERTPSAKILLSLSYLYNCSVDYLLGKKQPDSTSFMIDATGLTDNEIRIISELVGEMKKKK